MGLVYECYSKARVHLYVKKFRMAVVHVTNCHCTGAVILLGWMTIHVL